jgi:two-component system alkaline phosphatase synthesis response regulator PhoP
MAKTILVADDEKDIVDLLVYNLRREGYRILAARNGREALEQARLQPDLILLDVMMPEWDGWEVVKELKKNNKTAQIPVMFLTAKGMEADEILGLELGAEDYLIKPISIPKLLARVRKVLRRHDAPALEASRPITVGAIDILPSRHLVRVHGKEVFLPRKEFEVLLYLAEHAGLVISRETLLKAIWGSDVLVIDRTVDVHIRKIREKLGECSDSIETIKGVGYRLKDDS